MKCRLVCSLPVRAVWTKTQWQFYIDYWSKINVMNLECFFLYPENYYLYLKDRNKFKFYIICERVQEKDKKNSHVLTRKKNSATIILMFLWQALNIFLFVDGWRKNYYVFSKSLLKRLEQHPSEAVSRMSSVKKVFSKISQNSQQNTCARAFF